MEQKNLYPKIQLAQSIIEICKAKGIKHIVISPGSRNAPLTIGFTNNAYFKCYSIADERCAAFFALGMAQQLKQPVAVVCTSGSALLNYYPAFAEAFYSQIPLVVVSADRPSDKIDIGDGQTIRQENVFANHSLYNANLTENASAENDFLISEALDIAYSKKGPVHINCPFEEPLYETTCHLSVFPQIHSFKEENVNFTLDSEIINHWQTSKKILVVVGDMAPHLFPQELFNQLCENNAVLVLTEKISNVHHQNAVTNIDALITPFDEKDFEAFQPDILLTFGGMIVSKRIKAFLRKYKPNQHWHIDTLRAYDTFNALTHHFKTDVATFFKQLLRVEKTTNSDYLELTQHILLDRITKHQEYMEQIPFSDFKVFDIVSKSLPKNTHLQVSNSSAIRYLQLVTIDESIEIFCNRGTSGIDGSTSTAIGAAVIANKPTVFITGDISFFYDSNALWNNYIPKNFKIILVNNSGGGIFRILPGHQETPTFTTFFETSHNLDASNLCKMFGFNYYTVSNQETLQTTLNDFYEDNTNPALLEIMTPEKLNDKILLDYFKMLK